MPGVGAQHAAPQLGNPGYLRIVFPGSGTVSSLLRQESGEIVRYFLMTAWSEAIFPSRM
jgi:hypothetical protein